MIKIVVSMTEPQAEWLKTKAAQLGITVAELMRRIVDKERRA